MDSTRKRRPKLSPSGGRVTVNVSVSPEDRRMAEELAERNHGGNVSHLMRYLIRLGWTLEEQKRTAA